jgi:hypothetical protein
MGAVQRQDRSRPEDVSGCAPCSHLRLRTEFLRLHRNPFTGWTAMIALSESPVSLLRDGVMLIIICAQLWPRSTRSRMASAVNYVDDPLRAMCRKREPKLWRS